MKDGVRAGRSLVIPTSELELTFSTSGGPGGQHANKAATRVDVAWGVSRSRALTPAQRAGIEKALGKRIDRSGVLRLSSDRYRSQARNRHDVLTRLGALVEGALRPAKSRVATAPSASARERRLQDKKRVAEKKRDRRVGADDLR